MIDQSGMGFEEALRMAEYKAKCKAYDDMPHSKQTIMPKPELIRHQKGNTSWQTPLKKF